jgi:hypothetical protein
MPMLEKITNIRTNLNYERKANGKSNFSSFFRNPIDSKDSEHDSIIFSPAAVYLSRLKWHLKEIKYPSKEKVVINFLVDDLEFKTEFDFLVFYSLNRQNFEVISESFVEGEKLKSSAEISLRKNEIILSDEVNIQKFPTLKKLFSRISELKVDTTLDKKDSFALEDIIADLNIDLYREFNLLLYILYNFIDKLGYTGLIEGYKFKKDDSSLISLEKISTIRTH